jgi:hypothetical protein
MAVGEKRNINQISQVSWTDWTAMDVYYWLDHSFQYSRNINTDDEMHWIKLSTKAYFTEYYAKSQLTSVWDNWVVALRVDWLDTPIWFNQYNFFSGGSSWWVTPTPNPNQKVTPWVVFQDYFWFADNWPSNLPSLAAKRVNNSWTAYIVRPYDHPESTDESIEDPSNIWLPMKWAITAILNYNNSRLVVAAGSDVWVYYPELDQNSPVVPHTNPQWNPWESWWKKVRTYEAWTTIVGLTCSFEYLKVWAVDEWWNTQVYYYQGNNNLRNTFVYNLVDLKWVRCLRVYSINWIDYYVSSIDWTDWFVNFYKLVWDTPVSLFKTRAWLDEMDVNFKAPYFVWPTSINAAYYGGKFYVADAYGLFQFTYNPQWFDKWYMKWGLYNNKQVYWVCENQWYLYVSTEDWCYVMRVIDTWKPVPESKDPNTWVVTYKTEWYQTDWILISREYEWKEWWTITKMLDEIKLNFELNPNINESQYPSSSQPYWTIDVYVSPNNLWKDTNPSSDGSDNWFKVLSITKDSKWTRTEKSNLFNDLQQWESAFKFDWQTITYAIVITRWAEHKATPIVRQIDIKYHTKDKVNNVYDIN